MSFTKMPADGDQYVAWLQETDDCRRIPLET
jgi:hypothetical protein